MIFLKFSVFTLLLFQVLLEDIKIGATIRFCLDFVLERFKDIACPDGFWEGTLEGDPWKLTWHEHLEAVHLSVTPDLALPADHQDSSAPISCSSSTTCSKSKSPIRIHEMPGMIITHDKMQKWFVGNKEVARWLAQGVSLSVKSN